MSIFKKIITFLTLCEYGFRTWEVGYITRKDSLTEGAVEIAELSGNVIPTMNLNNTHGPRI